MLPVNRHTVVPFLNSNPHLNLSLEISPGISPGRIEEIKVQTRSRESAETPVGQVFAWQNASTDFVDPCSSVLAGANE